MLTCARHWTAHKVYALDAGLDVRVVADIAAHREPSFTNEAERAVYQLSQALLKTGRVPDEVYAHALGLLGERGVVELVALLGCYCVASFTLNVFELGLPAGIAPELEDPDWPG